MPTGYVWKPRRKDGRLFIYPTHLESFQGCARQFWYQKLSRVETTRTPFMVAGTCLDAGVNENLISMIERGEQLPMEQYLSFVKAAWEKELNQGPMNWSGAPDRKTFLEAMLSAARFHHTHLAPTMKPKGVQTRLEMHLDGDIWMGGYLDVMEEDGYIRDLKFSRKKKAKNQLPTKQGIALAVMAQHGTNPIDVSGFQFDYLIWGKPELGIIHDPRPIEIQQSDVDNLMDEAMEMAQTLMMTEDLADNMFLYPRCDQNNWRCCEDYCNYWQHCRGKTAND